MIRLILTALSWFLIAFILLVLCSFIGLAGWFNQYGAMAQVCFGLLVCCIAVPIGCTGGDDKIWITLDSNLVDLLNDEVNLKRGIMRVVKVDKEGIPITGEVIEINPEQLQ